ncbi:MAG: chemotaxis protein CheC [Candidatus Parabeggiatoa sp.]|nr:chemotaxis protein CheC [Candidatus Parabeggiatoa sp.]
MINLSDDERDGITELFNISVGNAANSLSNMVEDRVQLSVPNLVLIEREQAATYIQEHSSNRISAIQQSFKGTLDGTAVLFFPEEKSLELVRTLLQEDVPLDSLTDLEQDSMVEVGNIILNAILVSFTEMLDMDVRSNLPKFLSGNCYHLLDKLFSNPENGLESEIKADDPVMILFVDFITGENAIKGYVVLLLDGIALATFRHGVNKLLEQ